ncbi:MAG: PA0069 family radical SAM protein [Nitrospirae bacterium]|nr:PA0069 family radical SAM protein [Nitrospirota bacterium]
MSRKPPQPPRGRGALSLPDNRYEKETREVAEDVPLGEGETATRFYRDAARTVLNDNDSPDVGFSRSLNPYRGCEHGCIYCFARPTHAYLGLSPGLDFETKIFVKEEADRLLEGELSRKGYRCEPVALGINTDAYQPVEERLGLTRKILAVFERASHPVTLVTKSALVERDRDILASLAARNLVHVYLSLPTLNEALSRTLEPRATAPYRRLETIRTLREAGIPVGVLVAPVIPVLTDSELEGILGKAREAGAQSAGYVLLRLPLELRELFSEWLSCHYPDSGKAVQSRLRDFHGGELYDARFGHRMRGEGIWAELLEQRFRTQVRRLGYGAMPALDTTRFSPPARPPRSRLFPDFVP